MGSWTNATSLVVPCISTSARQRRQCRSKWHLITWLPGAGCTNGLEVNDSAYTFLVTGEMPLPRKCRCLFHFGMDEGTVSKAHTPRKDRVANRAVAPTPSDASSFVLECGAALGISLVFGVHGFLVFGLIVGKLLFFVLAIHRGALGQCVVANAKEGLSDHRRGSHRCCWPRWFLAVLQWASKQRATTALPVTQADNAGRLGIWGLGSNAESELRRRLRTWRHHSPLARDRSCWPQI